MSNGFITTHRVLTQKALGVEPKYIKFHSGSASDSLIASFGKAEVDTSASRLIRFFQSRGRWASFTTAEVEAFYAQKGWKDWHGQGIFYGLAEDWWDDLGTFRGNFVRVRADGKLAVTDEFILRCADRREEIRDVRNSEEVS